LGNPQPSLRKEKGSTTKWKWVIFINGLRYSLHPLKYDESRGIFGATWLRYSPAAANPSAINFVFTAPSTGALLYEKILMAFNSVTLNMTITNNSGATITPFNPGNFSLRDYPIHRLFNSVSLTLGSSTLSIPLNDVLDVYRTCSFDHDDYFNMGSFGSIKDEVAGAYSQVAASALSAIGQWTSQNTTNPEKRGMMNIEAVTVLVGGAYVALTASNNTILTGASGQYRVQFSCVEPLLLPIFNHIMKEGLSLTHLSQFQISFILADPTSIVCEALPNGATAAVAWDNTYGLSQNNINLFLKWLTPPAGSDYSDIVRP